MLNTHPHRQTYAPTPEQRRAERQVALALLAFTIFVVAAAGLGVTLLGHSAQATPVRSPAITATPLPPLDAQQLLDIRAEAFRAGLNEGVTQGCPTAGMSHPINGR